MRNLSATYPSIRRQNEATLPEPHGEGCHATELIGPSQSALDDRALAGGSDPTIDRAVRDLNAICRSATLTFTLAVGTFVVDRFYDGDLASWRNRDPGKRSSLRRLARHPDLAMSAGTLYRCVAMYELAERARVRQSPHVSTSHLRMVLPLLPREQERLLRATQEQGWSVRKLGEEVGALIQRTPSSKTPRGGRRRHSRLEVAMRTVNECTKALTTFLMADDCAGDDLSPEDVRSSLGILRAAREACYRAENRLDLLLPMARTAPTPP